jgi:hypothetical protein
MRYTQVTMQMTGEITDRQRRTDAEIQRQEALRRVTLGLRLMLEEHIPTTFDGVARFRVALDHELPFEVEWQQGDHVSGIATFFMADKPRLTCLLFSGYDLRHDAIAVNATDGLVRKHEEDARSRHSRRARPSTAGLRPVAAVDGGHGKEADDHLLRVPGARLFRESRGRDAGGGSEELK